jgi:photosystem II stability/assembly factor-like uncharacterized protein
MLKLKTQRSSAKIGIIFLLNLVYLSSVTGQITWAPTNGPYGAGCNKINLINNEVYSATACGIYSTNDNGISWTSRNNGLDGCVNFEDIEIINNTLIAGSHDQGVFISVDYGLNWIQSNSGLDNGSSLDWLNLMIRDVYINGNEVLLGTQNGVFKSTNNGQSWAPSNIGINETNPIAAFQFTKNGTSIFLQTGVDIYKSQDNGFTWLALNTNFIAIPSTLVSNSTGIFATGNLGVYKSTNNGSTWSVINNNLTGIPTKLFESNNKLYCVIPNLGSYISLNNGTTWGFIGNNDYTDFLYANNLNFSCNNNGVYSFDSGLTLKNCGLGSASQTNALFVDGNDLFSGTSNGVYKSTDEGNNWKNMRTNLPISTVVKCITRSGNNVIIGTKDSGIYLSNDNGVTWNQSNSGLTINGNACLNITMLNYSNGKVFLGAKQNTTFYNYASLFVSNNNGQTWNLVTSGLGNNFNISSMTNFGQYLILGTKTEFSPPSFSDGVYLSTNSGNSWLFDGLDLAITDVASNNNTYFAISAYSAYSTQNMGNTWDEDVIGTINYPLTNIEKLNSIVVVQTTNHGIYYLNNGNWEPLGGYGILGGLNKTICQKQNGGIFIGSSAYTNANNGKITHVNNGVSKYIGGSLEVAENEKITTLQISPNPVNFSFSINGIENLNDIQTIFISDINGKIVKNLNPQNLNHDIQDLTPGVYLVEVKTSDFNETKRIIKQ